MIFMNCFARSSRVTGPKMRVPIGSPCLLISTAALRSKRMLLPSGRRISLAVRTTTAWMTSPFFTRPRGIASLIETTITSPTEANLRLDPPSTLMHCTRRAPELSATSRLVCIWIMALSSWPRLAGCLLVLGHHFPALAPGQRPAFADAHRIAHLEAVALVVRHKLLRTHHIFLIDRMLDSAVDANDHGLVGHVAHHHALQYAP